MTAFNERDPFDLNRFVSAQQGVYERVVSELQAGRKTSHWIWFVFPQIKGLGLSLTTQKYAIHSMDEAKAYLEHELLGRHLIQCTQLVLDIQGKTIGEILGYPDDLKFRSSMTLYSLADEPENIFGIALEKYFESEKDARTLELLHMKPAGLVRSGC